MFTEKPTRMVEFDSDQGVPYVKITWQDGRVQLWTWNLKHQQFLEHHE